MDRASGEALTLVNVHLKAGGAAPQPTRRAQLDALAPALDAIEERGGRAVLLGDFNATTPADRHMIEALARERGWSWASEPLVCIHY